jgi:hypothetical protein
MAAGSACSRGARPWLPCARETREEGAMGGPMLLRTYRKNRGKRRGENGEGRWLLAAGGTRKGRCAGRNEGAAGLRKKKGLGAIHGSGCSLLAAVCALNREVSCA